MPTMPLRVLESFCAVAMVVGLVIELRHRRGS